MGKNMRRILTVTFMLVVSLFAGNTGKISGRIIDKQSKEALIGANIVVVGTALGTVADANGNFSILNLPPGTYTLGCSMIGYAKREYQNVKVSADLTTTINIELNVQTIETEAVVVVGSRLIQRDATSTAATFDAENFRALPVETFEQALQLQAGVTVGAGGEIHIRGGRSNEVLFLVDGVPMNSALDNTISTGLVATNSIQELSVISGAFNAEYGNAQSGVVNITTKEGPKELSGRFGMQTGGLLGGDKNRFLNINHIDVANTFEGEGTIGGSLPVNGLSFFLSTRYFNDKGYISGQRWVTFANDTSDNLVLGDKGYVSMNPDRTLNLQTKITYNEQSFKTTISYLRKDRSYQSYSNAYRLAPDYRPKYFQTTNNVTSSSTLFFSENTFSSAVISYTQSQNDTYAFESMNDPLYRLRGRDLSYLYNKNNPSGDSLTNDLLNQLGMPKDELQHFAIGPSLDRSKRVEKKYYGKFDLSSQPNKIHLLKAGVEASYYDLLRDGISVVQKGTRPDNDFNANHEVIEIPDATSRSRNIFKGNPYEFAGYAQDKMEFSEYVLNIGARVDFYNPDTKAPVDFTKLDGTTLKQAAIKSKISPRLSFAHSVTDRSKIYFSYGHFFQLPPYTNLFTGQEAFKNPLVEIRTGILSTVGGDEAVGNPNLKPQTTISYEVGYEQELSQDMAIYLKGYYRNIRNLLATNVGSLSNGAVYAYYTNRDYGNVRGINFTLKKRLSNLYAYSIDYTYQVAEGNASSPAQTYLNYRSEAQEQKQVVFLDWDQPHTLRGTLDYSENNWQVGIVGKLESGYPYTPALGSASQGGQQGTEENSARKPSIFNTDVFVSKEFQFDSSSPLYFGITLKVYNLFDTQNELYVFSNSGRATFSGDPALANLVQFTQRPDYFSKPRNILLGAYFRF
ncbi:MAG: TonB-dependent receptor [Bacteroidota bacterium]|nr:TonB-dependent receptor [Bacteroidota bacterium]